MKKRRNEEVVMRITEAFRGKTRFDEERKGENGCHSCVGRRCSVGDRRDLLL